MIKYNLNQPIFTKNMKLSQYILDVYEKMEKNYQQFIDSCDNITINNVLKNLNLLLEIYLESEKIILYLLNEIFRDEFYEELSHKKKIFVILNKFFKYFLKIDKKLYKSNLFALYTEYKMNNNICNSQEKLDILSCIAMPMGQMFSTLFYTKDIDKYYPSKLSKRSKILLENNKITMLKFYYDVAQEYEYVYLQMYLLILIEMFTNEVKNKQKLSDGMLGYIEIILG